MVEHGIKGYVKKVSRVIETFYIKGSCSNEWISNIWDVYTISITHPEKAHQDIEGTYKI